MVFVFVGVFGSWVRMGSDSVGWSEMGALATGGSENEFGVSAIGFGVGVGCTMGIGAEPGSDASECRRRTTRLTRFFTNPRVTFE